MKKRRWIRGPLIGLKIIAVVFLTSLLIMWLWNILVPQIFSGPVITYWQSMGLLVLSKLLFGGFGRGFRGRHHYDHRDEAWKEKLRKKMESMTPEEREKFRKKCSSRFYNWDINVDVNKDEENKNAKEIKVEIKNSNS